ncbi:N6-adenosine-methyltransferase MT-A70-like [Actinidia chinensis var. chinensis]|uniref:N6-adenosine-methyltransferase MT-A70-like n=1 Tax=Actinidia chinensis var. chinensis TaxID=1590841 RepID=A0A2R6QI22_ACTCC|nr:N6-adenosine-methyltransferase MT-A70-like [Actinidia chinensis var. chinensis]
MFLSALCTITTNQPPFQTPEYCSTSILADHSTSILADHSTSILADHSTSTSLSHSTFIPYITGFLGSFTQPPFYIQPTEGHPELQRRAVNSGGLIIALRSATIIAFASDL